LTVQSQFAETLTLTPNFGESGFGETGFGESGRHQLDNIDLSWILHSRDFVPEDAVHG